MSWYLRYKNQEGLKRLEKEARRFRLGDKIEREISDLVHSIVNSMVFGGVNKAYDNPHKELSTKDPEVLMFETDEFLAINRMSQDRLPDVLSMEVWPSIKYVEFNEAHSGAKYAKGLSSMTLDIEMNIDDMLRGPNVFAQVAGDRLTLMAYHEVIHFIKEKGKIDEKTKRYFSPDEDPIQYVFQDTEFENHMSDFHNMALSGFSNLDHNIDYLLSKIEVAKMFPEGKKKKKAFTRMYNTIREMGSYYRGHEHEEAIGHVQNALLNALRSDNSGVTSCLRKAKQALGR